VAKRMPAAAHRHRDVCLPRLPYRFVSTLR